MKTSFNTAQYSLALNVKKARLACKFFQEELAFRAGIDRTYASQIERAIANPSLGIVCALADALSCDLMDLLRAPKVK